MPFKAKEFENRYRAIKAKNLPFSFPPVMIGTYEGYNAAHNLPVAEPIMIGDPKNCLLTMENGKKDDKNTFLRLSDAKAVVEQGDKTTYLLK